MKLKKSLHYQKKKKRRDEKKERASFFKTWNAIPSRAIIFFSDGSAIPNPGPSGAGVFYTTKTLL